ncbi:DUF3050 domain-containing protein [Luteolibacter pohnpeiensis]|uniref:DUF3050 domain-containing protein n=1 Tax=Luteolibacter pohnpeiensis TaxID=454153 RepID=A0A934S4T3_9BACT|nr:DUF3050 domain-containing protein [Luteolibacter pohnpeiensis]MBK1881235.1 DUF3050 domain-containing protein [Luteolibacter pohnpeiensis]
MTTTFPANLAPRLDPIRQQLLEHRLYPLLTDLKSIRCFMEYHVFAVWDFMSLLKALQRGLTCVEVPWLPAKEPKLARLINEIVLGEESDLSIGGEPGSHYEIYLHAMEECGADTGPIEAVIARLRSGAWLEVALAEIEAPQCVLDFVQHTFKVLTGGKLHEIAAAFTYGREDLIPAMFGELVAKVDDSTQGKLSKFRYYLQRHIELDGDEHGEMGRQMVALLCGDDSALQNEAANAAAAALEARLKLWDGIAEMLEKKAK